MVQSIISEISIGNAKPVYLLHGEESYYITMISDYIEANVLTESEKAFNLDILYGKEADVKQVMDIARQYPLMASKRLIFLKEAQDFKQLDGLLSYLEKPNMDAILVICHKHKKIDGRSKLLKKAKSLSHIEIFESQAIRDYKMAEWVTNYCREIGHPADHEAANLIAEYLGTDLSKVTNEISKIIIDMSAGQRITPLIVKNKIGISKDYNIFELQNALGSRDITKANEILRYSIDNMKKNPLVVINGMLYNFFCKVYLVAENVGKSDQELAKIMRLSNTFFVKDYRKAAANYHPQTSKKIFQYIMEADLKSKGVDQRSMSEGDILTELLQKILFVNQIN